MALKGAAGLPLKPSHYSIVRLRRPVTQQALCCVATFRDFENSFPHNVIGRRAFEELNEGVRVIDLTEWDPPLDPTDLSALTAARWVAECLAGYEMR